MFASGTPAERYRKPEKPRNGAAGEDEDVIRTEKLMLASIIVELLEFIVQQIRSLA